MSLELQALGPEVRLGSLLNGHRETPPGGESRVRTPNQLISQRFQNLHIISDHILDVSKLPLGHRLKNKDGQPL